MGALNMFKTCPGVRVRHHPVHLSASHVPLCLLRHGRPLKKSSSLLVTIEGVCYMGCSTELEWQSNMKCKGNCIPRQLSHATQHSN